MNVEGPAIGADVDVNGTQVAAEGAAEELAEPTPKLGKCGKVFWV